MSSMVNKQTNFQTQKKKNIIYVDASSLEGVYKLGMYDKTNNIKHTLVLGNAVKKISDAEKCAVLYGLMYIQKCDNGHSHILMNDCEAATKDKKLTDLAT
jgi:hypothetical protein